VHKSAQQIRDGVTLFAEGEADDYAAETTADAIHRWYQDHGYLLARVRWRRERLSAATGILGRVSDAEIIVFSIDEGPELKVRSVEFSGNHALSSSDLAGIVTVRPFPL